MECASMKYWLPGLGVTVGLSLMAIAVFAQDQQGRAGRAEAPSLTAASDRDGDRDGDRGFRGRDGRDGRRGHHMFAAKGPEFCKERYARRAGFLGYLQAKLELTDAQRPLWDKYQQTVLDVAKKQQQSCLSNVGTKWSDMTALDRRQRMEQMLKAALDGLQATDQPLQALYQALTPDQHQVMDHPRPRWGGRGI
jgi:LTXXQ motif family protein